MDKLTKKTSIMERIDLNMKLADFDLLSEWMDTRIANVLKAYDCDIVRDVCFCRSSGLMRQRCFGKNSLRRLSNALNNYGLHLGMTDEELDAYQREYEAGSGTKTAPKADNIDWEQRRWELAKYMYELDYDTSTPAWCIKQADAFIEEYKQTLNKEGRQ